MASNANYRQTETRENESEPCAETSASDSENLPESSGCPSPDPPGQDQGTSGEAAIALIMEEQDPETLLIKAKPNIYLIHFLRRTPAKPASSSPNLGVG